MKKPGKKVQKVIDKYKNKQELTTDEFYIIHKCLEGDPNYKKNVDVIFKK